MTTIYGDENACWRRDGHDGLIGGLEPEPPLQINLAETVTLRSGFVIRTDELWRSGVQLEQAEYHRVTVASVPRNPITDFWKTRLG